MQEQTEIKTRIEELRQRFENLQRNCHSWARISPETIESYAKEIENLQAQLK